MKQIFDTCRLAIAEAVRSAGSRAGRLVGSAGRHAGPKSREGGLRGLTGIAAIALLGTSTVLSRDESGAEKVRLLRESADKLSALLAP